MSRWVTAGHAVEHQRDLLVVSKGCKKNPVTINLAVTKISKGYYLKGNVETSLVLKCLRCSAPFSHPFAGKFQAWTNSRAHSIEECIDLDELPFPNFANYLDLTEVHEVDFLQGPSYSY